MKAHRLLIDNSFNEIILNELFVSYSLNKLYSIQNLKSTYTEDFLYDITKKQMESFSDENFIEFYFTDINNSNNEIFELYKYENMKRINKIYEFPIHTEVIFLDNNSTNLFIVTNVTNEKYKYKIFSNETDVFLFHPQKGCQIEFDGDKCYGKMNMDQKTYIPSYALILNVYKKKPNGSYSTNKEYIRNPKMNIKMEILKNEIQEIDEIFTETFFEDLLYKKTISSKILEDISRIKFPLHIIKKKNELKINNRCHKEDLTLLENITDYNRFIQRFTYSRFYSIQTCDFLLQQYKLSKMEICEINKLQHIFQYVCFSFNEVTTFFSESYGLNTNINIKNASICPCVLECVKDFSCIVFLENSSKIVFEDGTQYHLKKGDFIIFNNKMNYTIEKSGILLLLNIEIL